MKHSLVKQLSQGWSQDGRTRNEAPVLRVQIQALTPSVMLASMSSSCRDLSIKGKKGHYKFDPKNSISKVMQKNKLNKLN